MVERYSITIPDAEIDKLKQKLKLAIFPDEVTDGDNEFQFGAPLAKIKQLANYWRDGFNIKEAFAEVNELPHYRTSVSVDGIGDIKVHFVHQANENKAAIPLLFCHGWPGSFIEVKKLLGLLKGDANSPAFHVVAPSLPNFGYSESVTKRLRLRKYAEVCHKVMLKLGYNEYVTQAGDFGYVITRLMASHYPKHCKATHLNFAVPSFPGVFTPLLAAKSLLLPWSEREREGVKRSKWYLKEASGYYLEQSTRPQTLGYSLADSPVGLLAWIYEKLHDWTDNYPWTDDEILTWISIYYFSKAGPAASVRIYYEAFHENLIKDVSRWIAGVKIGLSYFPKELVSLPKRWHYALGPVVFEKEHESGGHFASWEKPEVLAGDLNSMFGKGGPCYGIVRGNNGYK